MTRVYQDQDVNAIKRIMFLPVKEINVYNVIRSSQDVKNVSEQTLQVMLWPRNWDKIEKDYRK